MALWDKLNKAVEKVMGSVSGHSDEESAKSIHDEFTPQVGTIGGKKSALRENDLL